MKDTKKKVVKAGKKGDNTVVVFAIGGVSVTCANVPSVPPMPPTKNVTVTATGVTGPFGPPATSSLAGPPTAVLKRNGVQVGSQQMVADAGSSGPPPVPPVPGKWAVTFSGLQPGSFDAKVSVNWNVLYPEELSGSANCP